MPTDGVFRFFYLLGIFALILVLSAGVFIVWDELKERRGGRGDG